MKSRKAAALVPFSFLIASLSVSAAEGGNTTVLRKHHVFSSEVSSRAEDYDFIGLQTGLGLANVNISVPAGMQAAPTDNRTGMNAGVFFEHRFIPYFGVRTELTYVQRGFNVTQGQAPATRTQAFSVNYLELPLLAKAQGRLGIFTPYFVTGPFIGLMVAKGVTVSQGGQSQDVPLNNVVNALNFGWNFGGGGAIEIARHLNIELSARYSMGLSNVSTQAPAGETDRLSSLQFLTGLAYAI